MVLKVNAPLQSRLQHQLPCLPSDQTVPVALAAQHQLPELWGVDELGQLEELWLGHENVEVEVAAPYDLN